MININIYIFFVQLHQHMCLSELIAFEGIGDVSSRKWVSKVMLELATIDIIT